MLDRVAGEGGPQASGASWYLTRDGKQYGPLTDRELSLFAEGGNFKEDDLLWTAGFDAWKPADAVFGLAPPPETDAPVFLDPASEAGTGGAPDADAATLDADFDFAPPHEDVSHAAPDPNGEDVGALVQALTKSAAPRKPTLKERAIAEIKAFAGIVIYLWAVFAVLLVHEWVVLSQHHIGFKFYGLAMINAIILGKVMVIADHFRFAERLNTRPLVYPIVYKAVAFTTLLFVAYVVEAMLIGWVGGNGLLASVPDIGGSLVGALSLWLIFCVALLPFFAFKEIEHAVGPDMFRALLFGRRGL